MSQCPHCAGLGYLLAMVDGVRNGKRTGWTQKIPCTACEQTGIVTPEKATEMLAERSRRDLARADRLKNR